MRRGGAYPHMVGHSDSLNLAVAASLLLYEVFNQRQRASLREEMGRVRERSTVRDTLPGQPDARGC